MMLLSLMKKEFHRVRGVSSPVVASSRGTRINENKIKRDWKANSPWGNDDDDDAPFADEGPVLKGTPSLPWSLHFFCGQLPTISKLDDREVH